MIARLHVGKVVNTPNGPRPVLVRGARRWVLVGLRELRRGLNAAGATGCAYKVAAIYYAILERA